MSLRDYLKTVLQGVKTYTDDTFLKKNQGEANNGKYLVVGTDGNIITGDAPSGTSESSITSLVGTTDSPIILSDLSENTPYLMKGYVAYDTAHNANTQSLYSQYEQYLVTIRKGSTYINVVGNFGTLMAKNDGTFVTDYFTTPSGISTRTGIDKYTNIVLDDDVQYDISWCSAVYVTGSIKRKSSDTEPDSHYGKGCYLYPMSNPDTATTYNFLVIPNGYDNKADKPFFATYTPANTVDVSADTYPWDSVTNIPNVNPVAKTETMTQEVGVDENGGLFTAPSSGGGEVDLSDYQKKSDETLETDDKTVIGAINELSVYGNNRRVMKKIISYEPVEGDEELVYIDFTKENYPDIDYIKNYVIVALYAKDNTTYLTTDWTNFRLVDTEANKWKSVSLTSGSEKCTLLTMSVAINHGQFSSNPIKNTGSNSASITVNTSVYPMYGIPYSDDMIISENDFNFSTVRIFGRYAGWVSNISKIVIYAN